MRSGLRAMAAGGLLLLLAGCAVGVIPIPVQTGTATAPAEDATPPGPDGMEGDY